MSTVGEEGVELEEAREETEEQRQARLRREEVRRLREADEVVDDAPPAYFVAAHDEEDEKTEEGQRWMSPLGPEHEEQVKKEFERMKKAGVKCEREENSDRIKVGEAEVEIPADPKEPSRVHMKYGDSEEALQSARDVAEMIKKTKTLFICSSAAWDKMSEEQRRILAETGLLVRLRTDEELQQVLRGEDISGIVKDRTVPKLSEEHDVEASARAGVASARSSGRG